MTSVLDRLEDHDLLGRVVIDGTLRELLGDLTIEPGGEGGAAVETGNCAVGALGGRPLGVFDLQLSLPLPKVPFRLELDGGPPASGFHFWLHLSEAEPAQAAFAFLDKAGYILEGATVESGGDGNGGEWLRPNGEQVHLRGVALSLLIRGGSGEAATALLTPTQGGPDGIVTLGLTPPAVLVGGTGFGLELANGLVFDSSTSAAAPGKTEILGKEQPLPADSAPWQGILVRKARLFLPRGVPLLGGHAVETALAIGSEPPGIDFSLATRIPADGDRPEIAVRIECHDPAARGLGGFLPTLVEGEMELPLEGGEDFGESIQVLAGTPVIARVALAREPTAEPPLTRVTLGVEAQGDRGILTIDAEQGGLGERAAIAAASLATALIADGAVATEPAPDGDESGVYLHLLLAAIGGLSAFLKQKGRVVLHGVELPGEGPGLAISEKLKLTLDYSVDAVVESFDVGILGVEMRDDQPLRVRVRQVVLSIDRKKSGLEQFHLGFERATMEIEDPGGWQVKGPGSLFDVLGTRSGRGSMWIEVDLRFKLDLGPVKVEGATIRGTLDDNGHLTAELRGLAASLEVPGVIAGSGQVALEEHGFTAALDVDVIPLNVRAGAMVAVRGSMVELALGIDLPGAIPLANSGLGIYGLGGSFVANGVPALPAPKPGQEDLISRQLAWDHKDKDAFREQGGEVTIGVEAVIGTVPDLGFAFSAKAGLFLTVPDVAIRVGLSGKVMSPRMKINDRPGEAGLGPEFRGVVVVDPDDGVTIGLLGQYRVPFLIEARVPLGAHFPVHGNDWFIYLGADGYPKQERALGPIQVTLLPELVGTNGGGFVMMRGQGIEKFGRGPHPITSSDGFILAFGFGFEYVLGIRGLVWAEIHASADILLTTNPMLLAGFGAVGGSLNLGPVSIGVDAQLQFMLGESQDPYLFARVCGHVDLFFFELEGCVEIEVGGSPAKAVPVPNEHPLDRKEGEGTIANVALVDASYQRVAELADDPARAETVWPDTLVQLAFATPPKLDPGLGGSQFPGIRETYGARARQVGSEMLSYEWTLDSLELLDVSGDEHGPGTLVAGELSAAWQVGKGGPASQSVEPAELVLLSPHGELWLHRTPDAGAGLGHAPLDEVAESCQPSPPPGLGWTVGWDAQSIRDGQRLVPSLLSSDPTQSQLRGVATPRFSWLDKAPLNAASARRLPLGLDYDPAATVPFPEPLGLEDDRRWEGYLQLDDVYRPLTESGLGEEGREFHDTWTIELEDELLGGRLWLLMSRGEEVEIRDDREASWQSTGRVEVETGRFATRFEAPHSDPVVRVELDWTLSEHPGFIALGGYTGAAMAAANARALARAAQAEQLKAAKQDGPQEAHHVLSKAHRTVLQPGRTYRVDLAMSWTGKLTNPKEDGSNEVINGEGDHYKPPGGAETPCARSYWFRTAKLQKPTVDPAGTLLPLMAAVPKFGAADQFTFVRSKRDVFHPAMLERYFLGYEPGQSESARFCDDPLLAHFGADHLAKLADAYGFKLKLGLARTDAPGAEGELQLLEAALLALLAPSLLDPVGRRWAELAQSSPCDFPVPGATLQANAALAPEAWYELHVLAQAESESILDGRLPGVSFRTSRWRNPGELLDGLGFSREGAGQRSGDLELHADPALVPGPGDGSDAGFEAALLALGYEGLPAPTGARTSLLWRHGPGSTWLLAGALIESPEPVIRPGRLDLERLSLGFGGGDDPARTLELRRHDRSGSRLLFLAAAPIALGPAAPRLNLHLVERPSGAPLAGRLAVPPYPSFAWEPR